MNSLKIAVAQIHSIKGNVEENTKTHLKAIGKASLEGVHYIVFPELSLTGYEPELAQQLAFSKQDIRLTPFIESAIKNNISIALGVPIKSLGLPKIGIMIISNKGQIDSYEKMYLHEGEALFFGKGSTPCLLNIANTKIANAICADTNNPKHIQACVQLDADIYIAGVLISEAGYKADTAALAEYAKQYNMLVLMANHNQITGGWKPIGKSAIWSEQGLLACANETDNALVIAEKLSAGWQAKVVTL